MLARIGPLFVIFLCTTIAWMILGQTLVQRTSESGVVLKERVASTWGAPQEQAPPSASWVHSVPRDVTSLEDGKKVVRTVQEQLVEALPLEGSRVRAVLGLEYRQKGLLWFSTYKVDFVGSYTFHNTTKGEQISFTLTFPAVQAIYDDLQLTVDGAPVAVTNEKTSATGTARIARGATAVLRVAYRSQGLNSWRYNFGSEVAQVHDFELKMLTDFSQIDFPENTLSPSEKRRTSRGWELTWAYKNLVTGYPIAIAMPEKLQPGPVAARISFFAPISLFFFFFVLFLITTLRKIELHPMNYFFLSAAFFAFHLLLAYLVDHMSIHLAFAISSVVSLLLVMSYLRLVVGMRFAAVEAGVSQLVYLVLFSYAFFFKGYTGLAVTVGAILTLFAAMQLTGRVDWREKFTRGAPRTPPLTNERTKEVTP